MNEKSMQKKTVLIAEDEPLARETLRDWIAEQPMLALVGEAADGASALEQINRIKPDVVFMDIQMPEMTGLEVLRRLEHLPEIVFTTAFDQYAVTAFELNAVDYLLKPFSRARFDAAVERLMEPGEGSDGAEGGSADSGDGGHGGGAAVAARAALNMASSRETSRLDRILVRDRGRIFPLAAAEIEYLKADAKYTAIVARGKTFLVRIGISELEARLDPSRFVRIHRSALVNLDFVESMQADDQSQLQLMMKDGSILVASRDGSKMLRDMSI
jgi:two-component system LytT family response regulator